MKKRNYEMEWIFVSLTAAALTAALVVSCAPTHPSYALSTPDAPANPPVQSVDHVRATAPTAVVGNWICADSDQNCPVSKISLMADGSALADGQVADVTIQPKGEDAIHLTLVVPAHDGAEATTLAGDVATSGQVDEISLSGEMYARTAR